MTSDSQSEGPAVDDPLTTRTALVADVPLEVGAAIASARSGRSFSARLGCK
jgi:hypothetical protein